MAFLLRDFKIDGMRVVGFDATRTRQKCGIKIDVSCNNKCPTPPFLMSPIDDQDQSCGVTMNNMDHTKSCV